jgi:hypothetical protein
MDTKLWIGIDPGQKGAICFLYEDGAISFADWDNRLEIIKELGYYSDKGCIKGCYLEKVHSMPKQGVSSTFKFGSNFGWWQGFLSALQVGFELIPPQQWMKGVVPPKSDKKAIAGIAKNIYPSAPLRSSRGGLLDGRADALLLAHYCKRMNP